MRLFFCVGVGVGPRGDKSVDVLNLCTSSTHTPVPGYLCMLLWIPVYVHILYTEKVPCTSLCRHVLHIVQSFKHVLHCSFVFVFIFSF